MKKLLLLSAIALVAIGVRAQQGDKSQRPSPPAKVSETTSKGVTISIDYSQPAVKGRTIGNDIAPYGKVWRTGANEATVFEVNKDVKVEGKALPAGKYGLYSIPGKDEWVIIFNKTWKQWGTNYTEADDALRVKVKPGKAPSFTERMTFTVDKSGKVSLLWGNDEVDFKVQ
ncbi:hypothetical protein A4D02_16810 [Niastella koreensis]|uniref:DUF2911 domain-containing protein n=2 Tax=Niastella koreensis TaxID=354356 RepID=G8TFC0_NIAKG|nr:DUF2911 domain-containing protein [Niastella koreensis]AEV97330.1 hypothetical protein Niako_0951 [Niastella koreensis GR20-10]OQP39000.1 hypothetical protein A4D02_16810 [Niastella koreensis]